MPDMTTTVAQPPLNQPHGAHHIAPDAHGRNFYAIDRQFQDLLSLYLEPGLRAHMAPHFERVEQTLRMIDPFEIPCDLLTEEAAREGMLGISGDSCYDDYLLHREQKDNGGTLQTGAVVLSKDARAQYVPARARFRSGQ